MPPNEGSAITLSQFEIRIEEHQRSAQALARQAAQSAGYSARSFGLDARGAPITATEVDSRGTLSMVTWRKKAGDGVAESEQSKATTLDLLPELAPYQPRPRSRSCTLIGTPPRYQPKCPHPYPRPERAGPTLLATSLCNR
ncbi:hypothetical protein [Streptomyces sp. Je 1-332]|uniref:hypothetical protein n=1 Tax=Streptomyces sp. Je 1-332 TaxID=3231270 RepID=UPI00345B141B